MASTRRSPRPKRAILSSVAPIIVARGTVIAAAVIRIAAVIILLPVIILAPLIGDSRTDRPDCGSQKCACGRVIAITPHITAAARTHIGCNNVIIRRCRRAGRRRNSGRRGRRFDAMRQNDSRKAKRRCSESDLKFERYPTRAHAHELCPSPKSILKLNPRSLSEVHSTLRGRALFSIGFHRPALAISGVCAWKPPLIKLC